MEHYKSTLATAAVAAFGLVAAAHILHPGNYEDLPRHVRAPVMSAAAPSGAVAWVDPPARASAISALSNAVITAAQAAEAEPTLSSQSVAVKTTETAASRPEARVAVVSAGQMQKPETLRRHKVVQRRTRVHQAALTRRVSRAPVVDEPASASEVAPKSGDRFDPIGTLIHGLGLDS